MLLLLSIFKWVIYSTVLGSVLTCIILLFKLLFKEYLGIRWNYCVWLILVIRLLIPYNLQSPFSIFNYLGTVQNNVITINSVQNYTTGTVKNNTAQNKLSNSKSDDTQTQTKSTKVLKDEYTNSALNKEVATKEIVFKIACIIWLIGVAVLGIYVLAAMIKFNKRLKSQKLCEDKSITDILENCKHEARLSTPVAIVNTDLIKTPGIFGVIKPRLLLSTDINEHINTEELKYVFFHELAHLKRKDIVIRLVVSFLQILHWFNPIIWYAFYKMGQDMEVACDAKALSYIRPDEYLNYGNTIIKLLEGYAKTDHTFGMACIISDRSQIKRRITMISVFKKESYRWSIAAVIILIVLGGMLLTNGKCGIKPNDNKANDLQANGVIINESIKKSNSVAQGNVTDKNFTYEILTISNPAKIVIGFSRQIPEVNETTSEIAKDNNGICAINAGGFKLEGTNGKLSPSGIIIHDGKIIYSDLKDENTRFDVAGFDDNGKLIVGKHTIDDLKKIKIKEAVSLGPALVINGKPQIIEGDGGAGVGPRSAIGQSKYGAVFFVTVDGRSKESAGATLLELQNILIDFGAVNAVNLDGGSSSTLYNRGNVINHPSGASGERDVASAFVVLP